VGDARSKYRDGQKALQYAQEAVAREEKANDAYFGRVLRRSSRGLCENGDFGEAAEIE
jgi:hypothetical protein